MKIHSRLYSSVDDSPSWKWLEIFPEMVIFGHLRSAMK